MTFAPTPSVTHLLGTCASTKLRLCCCMMHQCDTLPRHFLHTLTPCTVSNTPIATGHTVTSRQLDNGEQGGCRHATCPQPPCNMAVSCQPQQSTPSSISASSCQCASTPAITDHAPLCTAHLHCVVGHVGQPEALLHDAHSADSVPSLPRYTSPQRNPCTCSMSHISCT